MFYSAIGSHNVWIGHVEDLDSVSHGDFSVFVAKVINSQLKVQEEFDDDFRECLFKHHCLDSGPQRLFVCLRGDCNLDGFLDAGSKTADCLSDKIPPTNLALNLGGTSSWDKLIKISECLAEPLMNLELKWQFGRKVFQFGWNKKLRVWADNKEVKSPFNEDVIRYKIGNTVVKKSAKLFKLIPPAKNQTLILDFERLTVKSLP